MLLSRYLRVSATRSGCHISSVSKQLIILAYLKGSQALPPSIANGCGFDLQVNPSPFTSVISVAHHCAMTQGPLGTIHIS